MLTENQIRQLLSAWDALTPGERSAIQTQLQHEELLRSETNTKFIPLYDCMARYLVLIGGGGSGKSIFTGRKLLERVTQEEGHRFLVCRKVAKTLRESCWRQLCSQIEQHYNPSDFDINKTDMTILYRPNGSMILFAGLDDVEKLKSVYNVTGIWVEEASELLDGDLNQLNIRLRGVTTYYKQIVLTFNPISVTHWLKRRFFDRSDPDAVVLHTTYKDNRFLDDEYKAVLEGFRDTDPYYYSVYCLGVWGVLGKTIFDAQKVSERIAQLQDRKPIRIGLFAYEERHGRIIDRSIQWIDDPTGPIKIYEEPKKLTPYCIGGDTAGEGSDFFTGQIIDNLTMHQAAVLKQQFDEDVYSRQIYCLALHYNRALVGLETNFSTYPVKELARLGYRRQFRRQVEDTFTHKIRSAYGFQTTKLTRPLVISELVKIVRENVEFINDLDTLDEMLSFVRNESGRAEAQEGSHDDLIMALCIAYYVRSQQLAGLLPDDEDEQYDEDAQYERAFGRTGY